MKDNKPMIASINDYLDNNTRSLISDYIIEQELDFAAIILPKEDKFFFINESNLPPLLKPYLGKSYGQSIQEVISKYGAKELQSSLSIQFSLATITEQLAKNDSFEFVGKGFLPNGEFTAKKHRMFYFQGDSRYVLYTRSDITKDVKLYEEQNTALRKISQKAKTIKDKQSILIDALSHGIRTPLNGIYSSVELLKDEMDNDKKLEYLDIILENARKLQADFSNLLLISDLSKNQFQFQSQKLQMSQFISEMVEVTSNYLKPTNHILNFSYTLLSNNLIIEGDPTQLRQIFLALIDNAIKFSPTSSTITVLFAEKESQDPNIVHFEVVIKDEGCGMSSETLSHIYEPFYFAKNSLTDKNTGLGLGLTVAKKIIEARGGSISIQSKMGKGTTVTFNWNSKRYLTPTKPAAFTNLVDLQGVHILLVEDNAINIMIEKKLLEKYNATITVATNGEIGYDTFLLSKNKEFDIILMDLKMPIMDGFEATRLIRKSAHLQAKTIPIIAVTANTCTEEIKRCYQVGMNDYAIKPIDTKNLIDKIITLTNIDLS